MTGQPIRCANCDASVDVSAIRAKAEIVGQMKHITAEVVRGDQPLDAKEELIADLRARLSHVEAEREQIITRGAAEGLGCPRRPLRPGPGVGMTATIRRRRNLLASAASLVIATSALTLVLEGLR